MKSHLIPEPNPIERHLSSTDAARMYVLDQLITENAHHNQSKTGGSDDFRPAPEITMRNFLRVVFVR